MLQRASTYGSKLMGTDSGQAPKMKWSAGHIHADDPDQMITEAAEFVTSKVSGLQVDEVVHWHLR